MKSLIAKWSSLAGAAACLAVGVVALQFIPSGEGDSMNSAVMVSSANADESSSAYTTILAQGMGGGNASGGGIGGGGMGGGGMGSGMMVPDRIIQFTKPTGPLPNWMTAGGTIAEEEETAKEAVRQKIRKRVKPDFNNVSLQAVLQDFSQDAQVGILIDTVALELSAGGVTPDDPISLTGLAELSLQRALTLILDPKELTYVIEPDYIMVTTKEAGKARVLRYYDLAHFLPSNELAMELISLVQTMVKGNWETDGGEDKVQLFGSMLVVSAPEETHLDLEGLLSRLSKIDKGNLLVPPSPLPQNGPNKTQNGGMF